MKLGEPGVFTTTKGRALLTTTTGALPRPNWYTENLRGIPLSQGFPASPTASSISTASPATWQAIGNEGNLHPSD